MRPGEPPAVGREREVAHGPVDGTDQLGDRGVEDGVGSRDGVGGGALAAVGLAGTGLTGADLAGAGLVGADLARAGLARLDLAGTGLVGADLARAGLARLDLARVDIGVVGLAGAGLAGVDLAGVDLAGVDLAGVDLAGVDEQQAAVVGGDGEAFAVRVGHHLQHPAQPPRGQPSGGAAAARPGQGDDLDRVLALGVRHIRHSPARAEHLRQPHPHAGGVGEGARGAVAVGEPVQAAAYDDGTGPARLVHRDAVQVVRGGHLVTAPPGARPAQRDVQPARHGVRGQAVDDPQVTGALVDDPGAVAGRVPGVERVVVGVAAQIGAVVRAGVQVADALVVGEEGDPAPDEHRGLQMPVDLGEHAVPVVTVVSVEQAPSVQPQPARRPAPVPLPAGRFVRRGAGEQQGSAFPVDLGDLDVAHRPPGQFAARIAVGGELVGPGEVRERLTVRGDGEDLGALVAVGVRGRPAADPGVGAAPVGQPAARPAVHRHQMDLGVEAAPARVRDVAAVGGEAGVAELGAVDGEPPGPARGVERGEPEVVLGHEAQQVAVEVRQAQITHPSHAFPGDGPQQLVGSDGGSPDVTQHTYETVSFP
ncbi:pentapeptide repeat-containing protein [Streptomyces sp. NPDC058442]|uniref:pentapeptide repeat-containing protein n=1 Tax=Streptomyces sp. NPDC058442 TaxID=3346503 RepID=UPI00364B811B